MEELPGCGYYFGANWWRRTYFQGIASAAKLKNPLIKIIGVEPEGAASALEARKSHHVVELDEANTIADGTAVKKNW